MAAVNTMSARWPEAVAATQQEIEATNARIEKEWEQLRAADAGLPEGGLRIDASGLEVKAGERGWLRAARWMAGDYERQVAAISQCMSAIGWRLNIIRQWLDTVKFRLPDAANPRDEEVKRVLQSVKPSVEDVEVLFLETADYIQEAGRLIRGIEHLWRRAVGRVLLGLAALAAGLAAGEVIYRVISAA